jgi:hypothetical protein
LTDVLGGPAAHIARPTPGGMALATPRTLDALGALLLRNHPLHLQQQVVFGALPQGPLEEDHLDASTSALIDQQDLIRILAGQALGRVPREPVHTARRDDIPQALQRWADQRGPTLAFVKKLHRRGHTQPIDGPALPQGCDLARHGVRRRWLLRRHPRVHYCL